MRNGGRIFSLCHHVALFSRERDFTNRFCGPVSGAAGRCLARLRAIAVHGATTFGPAWSRQPTYSGRQPSRPAFAWLEPPFSLWTHASWLRPTRAAAVSERGRSGTLDPLGGGAAPPDGEGGRFTRYLIGVSWLRK